MRVSRMNAMTFRGLFEFVKQENGACKGVYHRFRKETENETEQALSKAKELSTWKNVNIGGETKDITVENYVLGAYIPLTKEGYEQLLTWSALPAEKSGV